MIQDEPILVPKIMRVMLEFGDRILYVEEEEAERWYTMIKQQAIIAQRDGFTPPQIKWKLHNKDSEE